MHYCTYASNDAIAVIATEKENGYMKEKKKTQSIISPSRLLFYGFSLLVFYLAMRYMGKLKDIRNLLAQMDPFWILLIFCLQLATYIFYALILQTLLFSNGRSHIIKFVVFLKMAIVLLFVNQTLPSGGISGNGYLLNQLVRRKVNALLAFKALIMESISYYIAFISGLSLAYLLFRFSKYHSIIHTAVIPYITITGIIFFMALGGIMLLLNNRKMMILMIRKISRFRLLRKYIEKLKLPIYQSGSENQNQDSINLHSVFTAAGLQLCIITCDIITASCLLWAFHIHLSPVLLIIDIFMAMVIGALPLSPGSLIIYESAMTYFLTLLSVPLYAAMIVTLMYRFITFWLPIPIGLLLYRNLQRKVVT